MTAKPKATQDIRMRELIRLHGTAWLAIHAFCVAVLGEKWMDAHDSDFEKREFYPILVLCAALKKMRNEYVASRGGRAK